MNVIRWIILAAIVFWFLYWLFTHIKRFVEEKVEDRASAKRQKEREMKELESDKVRIKEWAQSMIDWAKEIQSYDADFNNLEAVVHAKEFWPLESHTRFKDAEPDFRNPVLSGINAWVANAAPQYLDEMNQALMAASNLQDLIGVYFKYMERLEEIGRYQYFKEYAKDVVPAWRKKLKSTTFSLIGDKLSPQSGADVLVYNKPCYIHDVLDDMKWFVCENEIIVCTDDGSKSFPIQHTMKAWTMASVSILTLR